MPLYFAYGSNMDAAAMAGRCRRARLVGRGRLPRWRVFVMGSGYLSIAPDRGAMAQGVLWDVPAGDVVALDRYEDVAGGLYVKRVMPVLREPFGSAQALIYVGTERAGGGAAGPDYLARIVAAAQAQALPAEYVEYLAHLAGVPAPAPAPQSAPRFRAIKLKIEEK